MFAISYVIQFYAGVVLEIQMMITIKEKLENANLVYHFFGFFPSKHSSLTNIVARYCTVT
jgi:hypothetical protein